MHTLSPCGILIQLIPPGSEQLTTTKLCACHIRTTPFEQEEVKPVLFVTGGGMTPVQASARNMETHGSLLKWVQVTATPGAAPVTSTRELESKCLKKERCALVMKAGPLEVGVAATIGVCAVLVFVSVVAFLFFSHCCCWISLHPLLRSATVC